MFELHVFLKVMFGVDELLFWLWGVVKGLCRGGCALGRGGLPGNGSGVVAIAAGLTCSL